MLLSDRDIRAEIAAGRLGIDPFDDSLVQPSSVDVRLDNLFRVFNNTRYTHIDPAQQQDELTSLVQAADGEPFVLHPGRVRARAPPWSAAPFPTTSPAAWRASPRSAGSACSPTPPPGSSTPASPGTSPWSCPTSPTCRSRCGPG